MKIFKLPMIRHVLFAATFFWPMLCHATHIKGGYISVERISVTALQYRVILHLFTSSSNVSTGGATSSLDFGDGQRMEIPEMIPTLIDENTGLAVYAIEHTYAARATYTISYSEPNRNGGIVNLPGSVNIPFYIESLIVADDASPTYASPELLTRPIFTAPLRSEYSYGISAVDRYGHVLAFQTGIPRTQSGTLADTYRLPENVHVNPFNGLVSWDTQFQDAYIAGEYLFNVRIFQFQGNALRGYITLEFTVVLQDVPEQLTMTHDETADIKNSIYVTEQSERLVRTVFGSNAVDGLDVTHYSDLDPPNVTFLDYDSLSSEIFLRVGKATIITNGAILRDNPYTLTVRGTSPSHNFHKDITFLIFSKETDLIPPDLPDIDGHEHEPREFGLYPNPFKEVLYLNWPSDRSFNICLYSAAGQIVYFAKGNFNTLIETASLSAGMYFYSATDGRITHRGKLVKIED